MDIWEKLELLPWLSNYYSIFKELWNNCFIKKNIWYLVQVIIRLCIFAFYQDLAGNGSDKSFFIFTRPLVYMKLQQFSWHLKICGSRNQLISGSRNGAYFLIRNFSVNKFILNTKQNERTKCILNWQEDIGIKYVI